MKFSSCFFLLNLTGLTFFLFLGLKDSGALKITRLSVPAWLRNGSQESVVLDCEYDFTMKDNHLVVKWFLDNDPEPIYQWIPELGSRYFSYRLQGRVNLDYSVSPSNEYTRYRAINIINPTTDLSGTYICNVLSRAGEDLQKKKMIIYAPPKEFGFKLSYEEKDELRLQCEAEGVFPDPQLKLYKTTSTEKLQDLTIDVVQTLSRDPYNGYNVKIMKSLKITHLSRNEPTVFECVITINGTKFVMERRLFHYPDDPTSKSSGLRLMDLRILVLEIFAIFWCSHPLTQSFF
ncbi:uncharacterized protein LOC106473678 [Limulus polyphemus]|uniref:Uncharacterized protein LOC106473678 n=1 Tax=Limulus polyphemus TaxID=6850 RepID=A0ABM1BW43_LIMPO|nr:uncharacterized protein LOC106473678 [Limulus polyphemus]